MEGNCLVARKLFWEEGCGPLESGRKVLLAAGTRDDLGKQDLLASSPVPGPGRSWLLLASVGPCPPSRTPAKEGRPSQPLPSGRKLSGHSWEGSALSTLPSPPWDE